MKSPTNIDDKWFFKDTPGMVKVLTTIFVRGDSIVIVPLVAALLLLYFFNIKFALIMTGAFIAVRYFGEMIYWLFHQFHDHKYRPNDMGFKNLNNNAVYILYQTISLAWIMAGVAIVTGALLFL